MDALSVAHFQFTPIYNTLNRNLIAKLLMYLISHLRIINFSMLKLMCEDITAF